MEPQTILEVSAIGGGALTILFAALSGYFTWRNGAPQISSDVISTYKTRVEQLEDRVKTCEGLHKENLGEIGKLKGINEEKDKRVSTLEGILQGRNPEMIEFMKNTSDALISIKDFFENMKVGKYAITAVEK